MIKPSSTTSVLIRASSTPDSPSDQPLSPLDNIGVLVAAIVVLSLLMVITTVAIIVAVAVVKKRRKTKAPHEGDDGEHKVFWNGIGMMLLNRLQVIACHLMYLLSQINKEKSKKPSNELGNRDYRGSLIKLIV